MPHQFWAMRDKVFTGIYLIICGTLLLISKVVPDVVPGWLVTWPVALIGAGLLVAVISKRKTILWVIPIFWGTFALLDQQMPGLHLNQYSGAISIIFVGLFFLAMRFIPAFYINQKGRQGNILNVTNVFSHHHNKYAVNTYSGGRLVCVMGSMDVKMESDFVQDGAVIDTSVTMGSLILSVPPNWIIKNSMTSFLGTITDNRKTPATYTGPAKTITLEGNVSLGSIEII